MKKEIWSEWIEKMPNRLWFLEVAGIEKKVYLNDDGTYEVYFEEVGIPTLEKAKIQAQGYLLKHYEWMKEKLEPKLLNFQTGGRK